VPTTLNSWLESTTISFTSYRSNIFWNLEI
jgi:hypothetical protein